MDTLHWLVTTPAFKGALSGLISAAVVDLHALTKFSNWQEMRAYEWSKASFRWVMGIVTGALTQAGFGALVS